MNDEIETQITALKLRMSALEATHQIITEVLLSQSSSQKKAVAVALSQILDRPDLVQNPYLEHNLRVLLEGSRLPSRVTPEQRRQWIRLADEPQDEP